MSALTLPLFPLQTVLFPGGALPLKIFEQRYMDMAKACIRDETPFGVCLIARGAEVGAPAEPHAIGTLARIAKWDMEQLGVLQVVVHGGERFRVLRHWAEPSGLVLGEIELLPDPPPQAVPLECAGLVTLLRAIVADLGDQRPVGPAALHRFDDAAWVGRRFCEVLPIPNAARQMLLELDDAAALLDIVRKYLARKKLAN
ncbi:MAG: LON peptidase substrate-binding domain-containing protein [Sulfurisoma sp.]|nr:LON peptidase substrate-binding domain-containing protein [Sulfurisoma sp.]